MRFGASAELAAAARRRDILIGLGQGGLIAALALAVFFTFFGGSFKRKPAVASAHRPVAVAQAPAPNQPPPPIDRRLDFGKVRAPLDVTRVAAWAVREGDNGSSAFAIVDKRRAQVYVFAPGGRLLGTSPVLLGYASGDTTVAGIGNKSIEEIRPQERTTPAGRFVSAPGRNADGKEVVWVDYDAAVSMHRVINSNPAERRLERLATKTAADNRISWGCINVPVVFFERTVLPNLGHSRAVVYVLPEKQPLVAFFPAAAPPQVLAQAGSRRGNNAKP
ncbi:hypothetical protein J2X20_003199 [Pelomonas saccharophila]|uniref:L,D-transpeptidase n=1 Tax=Roseateles saccharophilus TaxID=304 RepID=A0ABU1YNV4_ROSSA|nr:hypothetical protein [Roseateles saccharophilus]MDR7270541.1 hypothetical protein [Roseateles saccharophilus]